MLAFRAQTRNLGVPRMGKDPMDARAQRSVFRISGASGVAANIERVPFCGFAARCRININNPSEKGPASKAAARRLGRAAEITLPVSQPVRREPAPKRISSLRLARIGHSNIRTE